MVQRAAHQHAKALQIEAPAVSVTNFTLELIVSLSFPALRLK